MWAAILDKFQCCINPEKNSNDKIKNGSKEVVLEKLEEKVFLFSLDVLLS